jgi:riboflavin biosynthesis pyrimidine reductase
MPKLRVHNFALSLDGYAAGPNQLQQYLRVGLVDEMHLAIVPILLGSGERFFDHLDGGPVGYTCVEFESSPLVLHVRFARSAPNPL